MKALETALLGALFASLFGFFFRVGEGSVAAQVPPCPQQPCKTVFSWNTGTDVVVAKVAGSNGMTNTTNAIANLYAQA